MESSLPIWLIPTLTLIGGIVIGAILARFLHNASPENTQNQLNDLQERFENYQNEVVAHFSTTAELVNKLTENYQNVQEHLLHSAERLALDEASRERLLASLMDSSPKERPQEISNENHPPEPPKDYAPKAEDEVGTLHESFNRNA